MPSQIIKYIIGKQCCLFVIDKGINGLHHLKMNLGLDNK